MASMHDPPERVNDDVKLLLQGSRRAVNLRVRDLFEYDGSIVIEDVSELDRDQLAATLRWPDDLGPELPV